MRKHKRVETVEKRNEVKKKEKKIDMKEKKLDKSQKLKFKVFQPLLLTPVTVSFSMASVKYRLPAAGRCFIWTLRIDRKKNLIIYSPFNTIIHLINIA